MTNKLNVTLLLWCKCFCWTLKPPSVPVVCPVTQKLLGSDRMLICNSAACVVEDETPGVLQLRSFLTDQKTLHIFTLNLIHSGPVLFRF